MARTGNDQVPSAPDSPSSTSGDSLSATEHADELHNAGQRVTHIDDMILVDVSIPNHHPDIHRASSAPGPGAVSSSSSNATATNAVANDHIHAASNPTVTRRRHHHHSLGGLGTGSAKMGSSIIDSAQSTEDEMYQNEADADDTEDDGRPQVYYPALATPTAGQGNSFWPYGVASTSAIPAGSSTASSSGIPQQQSRRSSEQSADPDADLHYHPPGGLSPTLSRSRSRHATSTSKAARNDADQPMLDSSIPQNTDDGDSVMSGEHLFSMHRSQRSFEQSHHLSSPALLPHEILLKVLRNIRSTPDLVSALLVCKSWCQCGVELLWNKPLFSQVGPLIKMLVILARPVTTFPYAAFIKRLNFSQLAERMPGNLVARLTVCERLERLTLAGCTEITDDSLIGLLQSCKNLVALDMSDCKQITDASVAAAAAYCHRLQGLNLSGCKLVTDAGLQEVARGCPMLRRVKLRNLESLTDVGIIALAQACPLLLEVDLYSCTSISDRTLWAVFRNSSHLRELSLNNCTQVGGDAFPQREASLVYIKGATDPAFAGRRPLNHRLRNLTFPASALGSGRTTRIENIDPQFLHYTPLAPRLFEHVRYLDMTGLANLTDMAIDGIVSTMPHIRNLVLAKCSNLTDDTVYSICKLGKHIHFLHLGHVSSITDKAVVTLARACTRLRYIDLACCPNLSDLTVFEIAANLPRLKRIGLVRVANLTDPAIFALAERTTLERIHLSYCENVTVAAVHFLLTRLHRLNHLSLTGVPAFRRPDLQHFCRPPPKDFNLHQRSTFCVYSGKGVHELRRHLIALSNTEFVAQIPRTGLGFNPHTHAAHMHHFAAQAAMGNLIGFQSHQQHQIVPTVGQLIAQPSADEDALDEAEDDEDGDDDEDDDDEEVRPVQREPRRHFNPPTSTSGMRLPHTPPEPSGSSPRAGSNGLPPNASGSTPQLDWQSVIIRHNMIMANSPDNPGPPAGLVDGVAPRRFLPGHGMFLDQYEALVRQNAMAAGISDELYPAIKMFIDRDSRFDERSMTALYQRVTRWQQDELNPSVSAAAGSSSARAGVTGSNVAESSSIARPPRPTPPPPTWAYTHPTSTFALQRYPQVAIELARRADHYASRTPSQPVQAGQDAHMRDASAEPANYEQQSGSRERRGTIKQSDFADRQV